MTEYEELVARAGRHVADRAVSMGYIDKPAMFRSQLDFLAPVQSGDFAADLEAFTYNGQRSVIERKGTVPFHFNEFWTSRQRQAHSIHEVSYRACFKPQLPEFFISRLTAPGDRVYDPFMGRGTTPIQAAIMGRAPIGNDINPLSIMLTRPRLTPPRLSALSARLREVNWSGIRADESDELLAFYHRDTLAEILSLRAWLIGREDSGRFDEVDDWMRMVAINRLTGHSPGFFSVYSLPPNQAVSVEAQRKINEKRNQTPPRRSVPAIILKKSMSLLGDGTFETPSDQLFTVGPAERTPEIETASVQLVVTSPPFLDVVQYASDNWLRCWFAGIDVGSVNISMHKKTEDWGRFIRGVFDEFARVVKPGGHVAFEVGEVRNGKVLLEEIVIDAIDHSQFSVEAVMINVQEFTKTANCWGVSNNNRGTNSNRIVIARRR